MSRKFGIHNEKIATLNINRNTVSLWLKRKDITGDVQRKPYLTKNKACNNEKIIEIQNLLTENKYYTLRDLHEKLKNKEYTIYAIKNIL